MKTKTEVIEYINTLKGYEGYVQFSHRPLDKERDIFIERNPKVEDETGFVLEAYFSNGSESIEIRQINDGWVVSKTDISHIKKEDTQIYLTKIEGYDYKVKMAQIWENEADELCEGFEVSKLKKVVFAGFEG